jgi:nitrite transporter NirC
MFETSIEAASVAAQKKVAALERSLPRYLVLAALAGAYVGLGIALIFAVGAPLAAASSPFTRVVMGASFGIALSLVLVAGAELFTGNAMLLPLGRLAGRAGWAQLAGLWGWSLVGNLVGSIALAALLAASGAFAADPQRSFVEATAQAKMNLPFWAAFARGILANWLVCLAVWCSFRTTSDVAKLVMVFWCLFAFIGAGFEHSVANMTLLALALFQPHAETVTWMGYVANLVPVTLGNIVGGAAFVAGAYWLSSPMPVRRQAAPATPPATEPVGPLPGPAVATSPGLGTAS